MVQYQGKIFHRALIIIALFCFKSEYGFARDSDIPSGGIWILRDALYTPGSIDSALTFAANSGINKVFVQIRSRGDALYQSRYVSMNEKVPHGFDPLAYIVELGHELGLEVHVWFNTYLLWSARKPPKEKNHIYYTHPEWTEANTYGKMDWRIDITHPPSPDWEGIFLSPLHPEVNPYLVKLISELLSHYSVDGVHLDYIRYQDDFYGYNADGCRIFRETYGYDPIDIARGIISTRFGFTEAEVDSIKNLWLSYKKNQITDLLIKLNSVRNDLFPDVEISAAVKPNINSAENRWAQDWVHWIQDGLLDFVVPMNYYKDLEYFLSDMNLIMSSLSDTGIDKIMMGVAAYNQEAESAADKIIIARMNGFNSVCIFSYNSHILNLEWFDPVFRAMQIALPDK